jgi:hypothetical protein
VKNKKHISLRFVVAGINVSVSNVIASMVVQMKDNKSLLILISELAGKFTSEAFCRPGPLI